MPNNMRKIVEEFIKELQKLLGDRIKSIILYGSYARGDFNKKSDVDLMVLTDLNEKEIDVYRNKIWERCADIEIDEGIVISPLIRNIDEFYSWSEVKPFYINILKEGVVLHGEKN